MRCREAVRVHELWALAAELEDHVPDGPLGQARRRPLAQTAQPLRALGSCACVIDLPAPVQDERAQRKVAPTALGDVADRVQATQDAADGRKEALPGAWRGVPAVSAHRLRAVGRPKRAGLVGTRSRRGLQSFGRGRFGHGGTEEAAAAHRGWHLDLCARTPR